MTHPCPACGRPTHPVSASTDPRSAFVPHECDRGHRLVWVEAPITVEAAESYRIVGGRYVAMSFAEIDAIGGATGRGRRYLEYAAESHESLRVRRLAQAWLAAHPLEEPTDVPARRRDDDVEYPAEPTGLHGGDARGVAGQDPAAHELG